MKNLWTRLLSAIAFLFLVIGAIVLGQWSFLVLFIILGVVGLLEFQRITDQYIKADNPLRFSYMVLLLLSHIFNCLLLFFAAQSSTAAVLLILFFIPIIIIFIIELYSRSKKPFRNIGLNLTALLYVSLPLAVTSFIVFYEGYYGWQVLIGILIFSWVNDTAAYVFGSLFGRHKLFPRISPKKSVEGSLSGAIFVLLAAYVNAQFFTTLNLGEWLIMGVCLTPFFIYGDLVESMLKRSLKIKDSGSIMPGHGGFLDRFDAILFCLPMAVVILEIFKLIH